MPKAVEDVFKLDPKFSAEGWIKYTRYSDAGYKAKLRQALKAAGLPP